MYFSLNIKFPWVVLHRLFLVTFTHGIPDDKIEVLFNGIVKKFHTKKNSFLTENIDVKSILIPLSGYNETCIIRIVCLVQNKINDADPKIVI